MENVRPLHNMSEDAHDSNNDFQTEPEQIAQPLSPADPDFSQDDQSFLRRIKIKVDN